MSHEIIHEQTKEFINLTNSLISIFQETLLSIYITILMNFDDFCKYTL